jgi:glutathione S-transferase
VRAAGTEILEEEAGNGQRFPHIYGPLATDCVSEVREAGFGPDGEFHY